MTTTTLAKRVHNFGAGPAALPLPVLERVQAELLDYAGTGMSVLEMSHRSAAFEAIIQKAEEDLRALVGAGPDHAVLFLQGGASLQFAHAAGEPARGRGLGRLRRHRPLVEGRRQGSREVGPRRASRARPRRRASTACRAGGARARSAGRLPALHLEQHDLRHAVGRGARAAPGRAARVRLRRPTRSAGRSTPRDYGVHLRGRAEEPRPGRRHAGGDPPRAARARTPAALPARPRLPADGREPLALQHAAVLRDLRDGSRARVAARARRPRRRPASATPRRRRSSTRRSTRATASTAATRSRQPLADERDLPPEGRRPRRRRSSTEAQAEGLDGLKGHRSVGGVRASLYNACPRESVAALADFMGEFRRRRG